MHYADCTIFGLNYCQKITKFAAENKSAHTMEHNYGYATAFEQQISKQIIEYLESNPNEELDLHRLTKLLVKDYSQQLGYQKGYANYISLRLNIDRKTVYKYNK